MSPSSSGQLGLPGLSELVQVLAAEEDLSSVHGPTIAGDAVAPREAIKVRPADPQVVAGFLYG